MNTSKHPFDLDQLPADFDHYESIHTVSVDNRVKLLPALANLFSSKSYHISRFVSSDYASKLVQILKNQEFDWIQLETLYLAPYIPLIRKHSNAKIVMRAHNVEHEIWERLTLHTKPFLKRWYLRHLTRKLRNYEVSQLGRYDMLLPITGRDSERFRSLGYKGQSLVMPIGLDLSGYECDPLSFQKPISMAYIGSLDWIPNQEGIDWFLKEVWRPVSLRFPNLELHIAGRNTPDWLKRLGWKNVHVHGEVADAIQFINQHSLMVVPLLSGSGMRAKILEGMALGKVVLTTSIGLEGIEAKDKKEVLVADTPDEFIQALEFCFSRNGALLQIGEEARKLVLSNYDNRQVARKLVEAFEKMVVSPKPTLS